MSFFIFLLAILSLFKDIKLLGIIYLLLFFYLLPLINGVLDWLSTSLSRYLLQLVIKGSGPIKLILFTGLDILCAFAFLSLLLFASLLLLTFIDVHVLSNMGSNVSLNITQLIKDNFAGSNIWKSWLGWTLFSTLIPTVIYLFVSVYGLGIRIIFQPFNKWVLSTIDRIENQVELGVFTFLRLCFSLLIFILLFIPALLFSWETFQQYILHADSIQLLADNIYNWILTWFQ